MARAMRDTAARSGLKISDWHIYTGHAFGCDRPVMRGTVRLGLKKKPFFSLIDKAFEVQFGGKLAGATKSTSRPNEAVLHRLLQWSLLAQRINKIPVSLDYRIINQPKNGGAFQFALPYVHPRATAETMSALARVMPKLLKAERSARQLADLVESLFKEIAALTQRFSEPGQNRPYMLQIAQEKNVPVDTSIPRYPVFGSGVHAVRLASTMTGHEPGLAIQIARNKHETGRILRRAGLPGAHNKIVTTVEQAVSVAEQLGYPIVIKPLDSDGGKGVFADIQSQDTLRWAFDQAAEFSSQILVEKHFEGTGHRITLYRDAVLSTTRKLPDGVTGDGVTDIAELVRIRQAKRDKTREANAAYQQPLSLDEEVLGLLAQKGLTPETVLPKDEFCALRRKNNAIAGGITESLEPDQIHSDNMELCKSAAASIGLELVGVDLLIPDISVSWIESGALICELNAKPQVGYSAAESLFDALFANDTRIPVFAVLALDPASLEEAALQDLAQATGCDVVSNLDGTTKGGQKKPRKFERYFDAARAAIFDNTSPSVLCVLSVSEVIRMGLPIDRIDKMFVAAADPAKSDDVKKIKLALQLMQPHCGEVIPLPHASSDQIK